jgi:hypothetical protein
VFDDNIFPFQSLHPNVGAQLRAKILLLCDTFSSSHATEGVNVNYYMHIFPLTDALQVSGDSIANAYFNSGDYGENLAQNGAQTRNLDASQNSTSFNADSPTSHPPWICSPDPPRPQCLSLAAPRPPRLRQVALWLTALGPTHMRMWRETEKACRRPRAMMTLPIAWGPWNLRQALPARHLHKMTTQKMLMLKTMVTLILM